MTDPERDAHWRAAPMITLECALCGEPAARCSPPAPPVPVVCARCAEGRD